MRAFIYLGVLTIVVALTEGRSMMSGYGKPMKRMMKMMMQQTKTEDQPEERCKKVGQYLTIPGEQCKFLVCDYGSEPWKDSYGNIKLFTVEMPCAPGTFVQDSSTNGYAITNPCAGRHDKMCLPKKKSGYGMMSMKQPMKSSSNVMKMTMMMTKKKAEMQTMGYGKVMEMMKDLGHMMQNSMYAVMTMMPSYEKEEVEEMVEKAEHTGYGEMEEEEMKMMCMKMMKMMVKMEEMKEESSGGYGDSEPMEMEEQTGYAPAMMMVMPEMGYGKAPAPAPAPMKMPHAPQPMMKMQQPMMKMKMKQIMMMMKMVMKMMKQQPQMAQMGYGHMAEAEPEPQPTGYGMSMPMMEAKPAPSYGKMKMMMEKMMEKMEQTMQQSGYGHMMEPEMDPHQMMEEEMSTGYGKMEEMEKPMVIVMMPKKETPKTYWD